MVLKQLNDHWKPDSRQISFQDLVLSNTQVAGRLPQPLQNGTKLGVHFLETLYPYEYKMSIKKRFHKWTSELPAGVHGQSCRIDHACYLIVLKSNDDIFFHPDFVLIWVKTIKKVHSQLCSILLGLGQPTNHMWKVNHQYKPFWDENVKLQ